MMKSTNLTVLCVLATVALNSLAQEKELNIYSARHYPSDHALYQQFTESTGIKINRVDADDAGIIARLKAEGAASPADIVLLVDASRLWRGEADGLFKPIQSKVLTQAIPAQFKAKPNTKGEIAWYGFSSRARVIVYNKTTVNPKDVGTYESLAEPQNKGKLCIRSGSHPYNLSLFGAVMEHLGEKTTEQWLKGMVSNMARSPKGGDTDQIKSVASQECGIAVTNTYYLARLMRSDNAKDQDVASKVGVVFPNQSTWGTHVNIAGGAVAKYAPHNQNAIAFLEYLASPAAQINFADGNNEWPVARGVELANPALQAMTAGGFKAETIHVNELAKNQVKVQQMLDRVGFR